MPILFRRFNPFSYLLALYINTGFVTWQQGPVTVDYPLAPLSELADPPKSTSWASNFGADSC